MATDPENWLATIFRRAESDRWCTRPFCTTCGCHRFREEVWNSAAAQAGLAMSYAVPGQFGAALSRCSPAERQALVLAVILGLRGLSREDCSSEAFRTVLVDLERMRFALVPAMDLEFDLAHSPAGDELGRMRRHEERRREERLANERYNSPEAVEERKRLALARSAEQDIRRREARRQRDDDRLNLIAALNAMPVPERLARLAKDEGFPLDAVRDALPIVQEADLVALGRSDAAALAARIGRRRGEWGRLRRMLEGWLGGTKV